MGIRLRYAVAVGILAALFGMLGPVSAQASQALGTSVPAASHSSGIVNRTVQPDYRCGYGYNRYCYGHYNHYNHYGYYNHYNRYGYYNHYNHYGNYGHYSHYSRYGR